MSTRSNIEVKGGSFSVMLYRHCDGYPAVTGAHVLELAKKHKRHGCEWNSLVATAMASGLIQSSSGTNHDGKPRFDYELTEGVHGDIEHFYRVHFREVGTVISHAFRNVREQKDWSQTDWDNAATQYDLAAFAAMVNKDRERINTNIRRYTKERGEELKPDDLYPLVTV